MSQPNSVNRMQALKQEQLDTLEQVLGKRIIDKHSVEYLCEFAVKQVLNNGNVNQDVRQQDWLKASVYQHNDTFKKKIRIFEAECSLHIFNEELNNSVVSSKQDDFSANKDDQPDQSKSYSPPLQKNRYLNFYNLMKDRLDKWYNEKSAVRQVSLDQISKMVAKQWTSMNPGEQNIFDKQDLSSNTDQEMIDKQFNLILAAQTQQKNSQEIKKSNQQHSSTVKKSQEETNISEEKLKNDIINRPENEQEQQNIAESSSKGQKNDENLTQRQISIQEVFQQMKNEANPIDNQVVSQKPQQQYAGAPTADSVTNVQTIAHKSIAINLQPVEFDNDPMSDSQSKESNNYFPIDRKNKLQLIRSFNRQKYNSVAQNDTQNENLIVHEEEIEGQSVQNQSQQAEIQPFIYSHAAVANPTAEFQQVDEMQPETKLSSSEISALNHNRQSEGCNRPNKQKVPSIQTLRYLQPNRQRKLAYVLEEMQDQRAFARPDVLITKVSKRISKPPPKYLISILDDEQEEDVKDDMKEECSEVAANLSSAQDLRRRNQKHVRRMTYQVMHRKSKQEYGNFDKDVADCITYHRMDERVYNHVKDEPNFQNNYIRQYLYKVQWKARQNTGRRMMPCYYTYEELKRCAPRLLLDYLEKASRLLH